MLRENDNEALRAFLKSETEVTIYNGRYIRQRMAAHLDTTPENAGAYLKKFVKMGFARRVARGRYKSTPKAKLWFKRK